MDVLVLVLYLFCITVFIIILAPPPLLPSDALNQASGQGTMKLYIDHWNISVQSFSRLEIVKTALILHLSRTLQHRQPIAYRRTSVTTQSVCRRYTGSSYKHFCSDLNTSPTFPTWTSNEPQGRLQTRYSKAGLQPTHKCWVRFEG